VEFAGQLPRRIFVNEATKVSKPNAEWNRDQIHSSVVVNLSMDGISDATTFPPESIDSTPE
jgi:hypothetical protein